MKHTCIAKVLKGGRSDVNKPFSKAFIALFVAVMLLCSAVVAGTLFHQAAMTEEISQLEANLDAVRQRLKKQQVEYDQVLAELPVVQADAEALQPEADAAYAQEQALRQQRKDLRAENSTLADELAALQAQVEEANAAAAQTAQAIVHLTDALEELKALSGLYD